MRIEWGDDVAPPITGSWACSIHDTTTWRGDPITRYRAENADTGCFISMVLMHDIRELNWKGVSVHLSAKQLGAKHDYGNFEVRLRLPVEFRPTTVAHLEYLVQRALTAFVVHRPRWSTKLLSRAHERLDSDLHDRHAAFLTRLNHMRVYPGMDPKESQAWLRAWRHARRDPRLVAVPTCDTIAKVGRGRVELARDSRKPLERRVDTKISRYFASIGLSSTMCSRLSAQYRARYEPDADFTMLRGDEIRRALYHGAGSRVCMSGESASPYAALYYENPDKVNMLMLNYRQDYVEQKPIGDCFAFVWTDDDGRTWLDNLYPGHDQHRIAFMEWAKKNNAYITWDRGFRPETPGLSSVCITLKLPSSEQWPYLDSFDTGTIYHDKLVLSGDGNISFHQTDGTHNNSYVCYECDCGLGESDYHRGANDEIYCDNCYYDLFTNCERCGDTEWLGEVVEVVVSSSRYGSDPQYWCTGCAEYHASECDNCCTTVVEGLLASVRMDNGLVEEQCEMCISKNAHTCDNCGDNYETMDDNDPDLCADCAKENRDEQD